MSFIHCGSSFQTSSPDNVNLIYFRDPAQLLREEIDELSKVQPLQFNLVSKLEFGLNSCFVAYPISLDMRSAHITWNQYKTESVLRCLVLRYLTSDDPSQPNPLYGLCGHWIVKQKKKYDILLSTRTTWHWRRRWKNGSLSLRILAAGEQFCSEGGGPPRSWHRSSWKQIW